MSEKTKHKFIFLRETFSITCFGMGYQKIWTNFLSAWFHVLKNNWRQGLWDTWSRRIILCVLWGPINLRKKNQSTAFWRMQLRKRNYSKPLLLNSSRLAENGTSREKEITLVQRFFCDYFTFLVWNITSELKLHKYFLLGFNTYDKQHFISAMKLAELKKKLRDGLVLSCNQPWLSKVTNQKRSSSIVFGGSPVIRKVTVRFCGQGLFLSLLSS